MITPISKIVALIPQDSEDEALDAVELVVTTGRKTAVIRVHLSGKFKVNVSVNRDSVELVAEGGRPVRCTPETLLTTLKSCIYDVDEAMQSGAYKPPAKEPAPPPCRPPAPAHMDIPVWDSEAGKWYDAEH